MATSIRELTNSPVTQGVDEKIAWPVTVLTGHTPTSIVPTVKDLSDDNAVVTDDVMPSGSASAVANVITLPLLQGLTVGHRYRVEVKYNNGTEVFEPWFIVKAEE